MTAPDAIPVPSADPVPLPPPNPFARIRARWIFIGWLGLGVLAIAILEMIPATRGTGTSLIGAGTIQYAALALIIARAGRRAGLHWPWLFGPPLEQDHMKLLAVVFPVAAVSLGSYTLFWGPLSYVIPEFVQQWAVEGLPELLTPGDPIRMVAEGIIIVVIAPVMEEILFRGVLLHRWSYRWGLRAGIIVTSLLFGVIHVEPVGHFFFGVVMCALYLATGSLWVPIAAHVLNNGIVMLVMLPGALRGETVETPTLDDIRGDWGEAIALVAVGMTILIWFLRRYLRIRGAVPPYVARAAAAAAPSREG